MAVLHLPEHGSSSNPLHILPQRTPCSIMCTCEAQSAGAVVLSMHPQQSCCTVSALSDNGLIGLLLLLLHTAAGGGAHCCRLTMGF
jgi:hypothetical protein